ncbi:magnesium transporter [Akkermansiaceae bacterium]|nr:magnesium transporter [Akkermansiaceae bacterium]MDA7864346.1 magnesium transporter [Akkermansiaceae bacterium]MDB0057164.1 magnesium transporter [Akkermansiaceae bacterium]MDB4267813.1 magnesium transporter [Akkermansiaceae bacterium]MDB4276056.1 magnesium transporter [Akkermansiaceae bacterium]
MAEILNQAELAVGERKAEEVVSLCKELHAADIASLYEDLDSEAQEFLVDTLGTAGFSNVLAELPDTLVEEALDHFEPVEQREILGSIPDDDRVDILQDVSESKRRDFIDLLDEEEQDRTRALLRYGEETAGGRMTTQVGKIFARMTVKEAIDHLRPNVDLVETMARIFVIDVEQQLIGVIRLRDLAFHPWDTPIRNILTPEEHTILASADQEDAAKMLARYDMALVPVVDESGRLLGVITPDDAIEILEEESTEDIEKAAGIAGDQSEKTYLNTGVMVHFKRRFGWLLILALLAIASGYVMLRFESVLNEAYLLALFLPMVVAAGGNTGGQASTMVIRAMALGELDPEDTRRVAWKELRLGLLSGLLLGGAIALVATFILPLFRPELPAGVSFVVFGLAVAVALMAQVASSTVIGALLPIGARAIKLDPAVVAAPAITTIVDASGMVIYFTVARAMLGL